MARALDHEFHCGSTLTGHYINHPTLTSNECEYEELLYKGYGLVSLCKRELVYMMPVAMAPHKNDWICGRLTSACCEVGVTVVSFAAGIPCNHVLHLSSYERFPWITRICHKKHSKWQNYGHTT